MKFSHYSSFNQDFNLDFDNPKIVTAKEIFTEKQYREFIKTYSTDERFSLVDFVLGFFKKNEDDANQSTSSPSPIKATKPTSVPDYAKALKPTVSIGVLQEKTASFIQGKIDGKSFYTVLKAAFGDKLVKVLPDIIASLPQDKGDALAKAAK